MNSHFWEVLNWLRVQYSLRQRDLASQTWAILRDHLNQHMIASRCRWLSHVQTEIAALLYGYKRITLVVHGRFAKTWERLRASTKTLRIGTSTELIETVYLTNLYGSSYKFNRSRQNDLADRLARVSTLDSLVTRHSQQPPRYSDALR